MLKYAIIGFGGLGKLHYSNTETVKELAGDVQLVAICDGEESAFCKKTATNLGDSGEIEGLSNYNLYTDVDELLEKEELDFVITALPTFLHEPIAVKIMKKGIHVFSEKPMAINCEQAENMLKTAKENNVKLMIGQCLRFDPIYASLRDIIKTKKYGKLIHADLHRLSVSPRWSWRNWMNDDDKSGCVALDLHVHDVDFVNWTLGAPKAVTAFSTSYESKHDALHSIYHYDDVLVHMTADWSYLGDFTFTAGMKLKFEDAVIVQENRDVTVYPREGASFKMDIPYENCYVNEIVEFIKCIREDRVSENNPPEESKRAIEIAFAEMKSANICETVKL